MNSVALAVDAVANLLRLFGNLLVRLLPAPEYVVMQVSGSLPERRPIPPGWLQRIFLRPYAPAVEESLEEWRERLKLLASDSRVRGVVMKIGDLRAGLTALESLRRALEEFRASGKRLAAYLPTAGLYTYYLASAAEMVVVPESAELHLHGPRTEATFLRVALDRLGILPQFHHIAEYKSAANRFLYPRMPDPQREMLNSVLDDTFDTIITAVSKIRQVPAGAIREAIDQGILSAAEARDRKLVDAIAFEDELGRLFSSGERPVRILAWAQARRRIRVPYRWRSLQRRAIAVVQLIGSIVPGESREFPLPVPFLGQRLAGHETVARAFRLAEKIPAIKAIVFHVDSGGGSAVASDLIWREVARVQAKKPVVVHMSNMAGSGGYYIACGARHIVAGSTTVTGSIGVVAGKFDLEGIYARGGLRREIVARGATATFPSAFAPYSEREWAALRQWMEEIYMRFKERVASGRRKSVEAIESIARGRVWTGRQALELGLVDEVGDFEAAVRKAKVLAGIPMEAEVPVLTVRPPRAFQTPPSAVAAWAQALETLADLLREHALLLIPPEFQPRLP